MPKSNRKNQIEIKGARVHNLKNVDLTIPKFELVVFTGVSGSGKSSLCIDTLFAEGQRRYVESLSAYARQFLNRMAKPDVDYIKGICPAIAIEQKVSTKTTRSTVGSLTEIYDYLRILFARIGKTYSPISGDLVGRHDVTDVVDYIFHWKPDTKIQLLFPVKTDQDLQAEFQLLFQKGYTRVVLDGQLEKLEQLIANPPGKPPKHVEVLIDRITAKPTEENKSRAADSAGIAFFESDGECIVDVVGKERKIFNNRFELDGMTFEQPNDHFFNFNSPFGACKTCEGFGTVIGIDEDKVVPNKSLSVYEGAIACWKGEKMKKWLEVLLEEADELDFPVHRPYRELAKTQRKILWEGKGKFKGLNRFFKYLEEKSYKIQFRVMLSRYRGRTSCPDCEGSRIRKDAAYVKIADQSIIDLLVQPISAIQPFFEQLELSEHDQTIAERILTEIKHRVAVMMKVGLSYLTLNRMSNTLSGGETQRINLTRSLGSNLTNSMYILDEPSIGLHSKDTERLITVLKELRDLKNTVIVVEHDEDVILAADHLVDMGPEAGVFGGEVIFNGPSEKVRKNKKSLTGRYLTGDLAIPLPDLRRKSAQYIHVNGATEHNLKNVSVKIPLGALTAVSGVSGSGKTTLIKKVFYPAVLREVEGYGERPGAHKGIAGDFKSIGKIELVDQNPLGRSSRSNPVTYIKAYDAIRDLFSKLQLSKVRGYKPKMFSFNVEGGRCEVCKGDGNVIVEMQFLADVELTCEECSGRRFKEDVLEVKYKDKNIFDVLNMSVDEAMAFFEGVKDVHERLKPLQDVGLGYVKLGQSSSTLSGGEAQRVKLAYFLGKGKSEQPVLFVFDEPTTGLHFHDIRKLLNAFNQLIELGHTVVVIEHNMEVLKSADWLIDLGPEGGEEGGHLLYQGIPEGLVNVKESHTAKYLAEKLNPEAYFEKILD